MGIFCHSYNQLLVVRTFVGIAEGPMLPLMMSALNVASDPKRFGMNSGIVNAGVGAIGATLGPVLITQLVAHYSWNMTFLLSALPTFVMVILLAIFLKEVKVTSPAGTAAVEKPKFGDVFKYRNVVLCILICILSLCGYWTLMLFAPLYLVNVSKLSVQNMGWVSGIMGVLYILYCIIVPKMSDNFGRKPVLMGAFLLSAVAPLAMYLFQGSTSSVVMYAIFGGFTACMTPIYMTLVPMESVPVNLIATANAVVMGAGDLFGSASYPILAGRIADAKGLPFMMLFAAMLLVLAILFSFGLIETHPRRERSRATLADAKTPLVMGG
jgi:MFS family permease